jgi:hypothetical protein
MNPVPVIAGGVAVAVVPPLRRRVVPVTAAVVGTAAGVALAAVAGAGEIARAVLHGSADGTN